MSRGQSSSSCSHNSWVMRNQRLSCNSGGCRGLGEAPTCNCGVATVLRMARTIKNGGRQFRGCSNFKCESEVSYGCNFFKWCIEDEDEQWRGWKIFLIVTVIIRITQLTYARVWISATFELVQSQSHDCGARCCVSKFLLALSKCLVLLFGYEKVAVARRTVARSDTLAQASLSRLSATCRSRLGSHSNSRSGERRSLKRERVGALVCCSSLSLGEELHLWVRSGLAQARRARLSERSQNLPWPLSLSRLSKSLQLKREHPSRLSEGFWLERDVLQVTLFFLTWFLLVV
ncbi:hypothetical protein DEO72_LG3g683 [Vigna unguiculata]|uniref:GRF-type domain-containing protein n=1 Tax=Vigna unguiculata TaxID=3917 RepID=A0A4D6LC64_VIGUN|nr:hypothetical protein DEO72_LG3g683 [Vigna unguiculata]